MARLGCALLAFLATGGIVPGNAARLHGTASTTPVQKVLEMLTEMIAKGQKEKEVEKMIFEKYAEWVDDQEILTLQEIKTAKTLIDKLTAEIDKAQSDIDNLSEDIDGLDGEISAWEKDQKKATDLRNSENAEFEKVQADYSESIDAIGRAIMVLQQQNVDVKQAATLLQETATKVPRAAPVLAALIQDKSIEHQQTSAESITSGAPAVAAYEFQSGGLVEMLEKLKKKFKEELASVEEAESNAAHAYDLEMLHLGNNIENAKGNRDEKAEHRAALATQSAQLKGELADTQDGLATDEKYLADMKATFKAKSSQFADNQKVRAEEIEAMQKALKILSDPAVAGHAEKYLPKFVQKSKATSLLQLGSAAERNHAKDRAASFLKDRATALSSKVLSTLAREVAGNPFAKVIEMIKGLIATLEEEAQAEAGHKAFCDQELAKNKNKRETKASEVASKTATVNRYETEIQVLGTDIATLAKEQQELTKAMQEATEERNSEKKENLQTIKDAKEAQDALSSALAVLKDFYAKQGGFIQKKQVPEMKAYKGMSEASGGVVGMIEVIQSDFARLEAETTASENTAQREYDEFMTDAKADIESKHKEEFDKGLLKDQKEYELKLAKKDLGESQTALDAALEYYAQLKPQCIEVHVSYEERVARRKQEIEALQEAYRILSEMGPGA